MLFSRLYEMLSIYFRLNANHDKFTANDDKLNQFKEYTSILSRSQSVGNLNK